MARVLVFRKLESVSTKIYNGYLLPTYKSIGHFHKHMCHVRDALKVVAQQLHIRYLGEHVSHILTKHQLGLQVGKPYTDEKEAATITMTPLDAALSHLYSTERENEKSGTRFLEDLRVEWVVIPHRGSNYCLLYTDQKELTQEFVSQAVATPHPYWNNADAPEGITAAKWRARGKEWENVLRAGVPAECGWTMRLQNSHYLMPAEILLRKANPTAAEQRGQNAIVKRINQAFPLAKRAREEAANSVMCRRMQKTLKASVDTGAGDRVMDAYWVALKWAHTPEGQAAVEKQTAQYVKKLRLVTVEDLVKPIKVSTHQAKK